MVLVSNCPHAGEIYVISVRESGMLKALVNNQTPNEPCRLKLSAALTI
jgi:hypothetical protein